MKTVSLSFTDFGNNNSSLAYKEIVDFLQKYCTIECTEGRQNPDYIIYACFGDTYLQHKGIRIYYATENLRPDFNLCDYALAFDHLSFGDRYIRFPFYLFYAYADTANTKHLTITRDILQEKKKFCNFVVSNSGGDQFRTIFFEALSQYKHVDSGGKYKNNIGKPVENKYEFQKGYKFSLAFENSNTEGYVTEKILEAFVANTIPIYWGDPAISTKSGFNPKAFINVQEYATIEDAIARIREIDNDDEQFLSMLQEPVFLDTNHVIKHRNALVQFLENIFNSTPEEAKRRGFGSVTLYERRLKHALSTYALIRNSTDMPIQYIKKRIRRFLGLWRRK